MTTAWSVQDNINALFSRITDCAEYAQFSGSPIFDHDKKEATLFCFRYSQEFNQAYLDYEGEANKTYVRLKLFFKQRDLDRKEITSKTGEFRFGGNAQEEDGQQWDE